MSILCGSNPEEKHRRVLHEMSSGELLIFIYFFTFRTSSDKFFVVIDLSVSISFHVKSASVRFSISSSPSLRRIVLVVWWLWLHNAHFDASPVACSASEVFKVTLARMMR